MVKDQDLVALSHENFWNARYAAEQEGERSLSGSDADPDSTDVAGFIGAFEWFRSYDKLRPFLGRHLPSAPSQALILHLGCGNSTLTSDLHHAGYGNQISVDFSHVLIRAMRLKYGALQTRWEVMDVRRLQLESGCVHVAVDKGTLDAFIHGSLWDPPVDVRTNVAQYVNQVARVLKPSGKWLYVTYRQPHFIKPLLERETWSLEVEVLEDPNGAGGFDYFGFVMTKK